ncbi:MAG: rhomboid family intramembrane serine protease [Verrucomicrobiota bacterium]
MRRENEPSRWSMTTILLAVNVACFLVQNIASYYSRFPVNDYFALSLSGLSHGYAWQLLTFQFMHGGVWHLLFNCFAIYFFGRAMEEALGARSFLKLYFLSGVLGGSLQLVGALILPKHMGSAVMGASAGAFGLIAAYATLFPERSLTMLLFLIIPITIKAKYLLLFSGALAIFGILIPNDNVAHGAHLGGMLVGIFFIRWRVWEAWSTRSWFPFRRTPSVRELVKANSTERGNWRRAKTARPPDEELPAAQFISQEVDPILDKISAQGIHSLTEDERQILDAARKKMARR